MAKRCADSIFGAQCTILMTSLKLTTTSFSIHCRIFISMNLFLHFRECYIFSSNSTNFSVVIENTMGYRFSRLSLIRQSHGCPLVEKCKMLHFRNSCLKFKFISLLFQKSRNLKCVLGTHFQPFNIRLKPICN